MKALNMGSELADSTTTFFIFKEHFGGKYSGQRTQIVDSYQRSFHYCECVEAVIVQQGLRDVSINQDGEHCKAANLWVGFAYRAETKKRRTFTE